MAVTPVRNEAVLMECMWPLKTSVCILLKYKKYARRFFTDD